MTADGSTSGGASAHHHQHATATQAKINTYFPLGYKEAAQQWVCSSDLPPHRQFPYY